MKEIKNINQKINKYFEHKKDEQKKFQHLDKTLRKRTQTQYINELRKEKKKSISKYKKSQQKIFSFFKHFKKINFSKNNFQWISCFINGFHHIREILSLHKWLARISKKEKFNEKDLKKPAFSFENFSLPKMTLKKSLKYIGIASAGAACIILVFAAMNRMTAYKVSFNGQEIGIVKNPENVLYLAEILDKKLDLAYNADIIINEESIQFEKIRGMGLKYTTDDEILDQISYFSNLDAKAYAVNISGQDIATFSKKEEAKEFLEAVKNIYVDQDNESVKYDDVSFLENVTIKEKETTVGSLSHFQTALDYVLTGTDEEKLYKVKKGENYWTIADKYGITPEDLEAANPQIDPEKLQIGQEISLIVPKPLITVVTKEKETYYESIPFDIEYENTGALFEGENQIKLSGKKGKKEVLAEVERQNGIEVSRTEVESEIIKEPQTQVVLVGTKELPPLIGTGSFDNPARGTLSSRFGVRWGRMHKGIDIAGPIGTTIRAADGGVVTFAGWNGNYGLAVIVDHGQNKSTLYGHCNKLLVKKGEKVYKGKKIAEMGSTGRSTGPHVHFEVRVNGVAQNPLNYVNY